MRRRVCADFLRANRSEVFSSLALRLQVLERQAPSPSGGNAGKNNSNSKRNQPRTGCLNQSAFHRHTHAQIHNSERQSFIRRNEMSLPVASANETVDARLLLLSSTLSLSLRLVFFSPIGVNNVRQLFDPLVRLVPAVTRWHGQQSVGKTK